MASQLLWGGTFSSIDRRDPATCCTDECLNLKMRLPGLDVDTSKTRRSASCSQESDASVPRAA